MDKKRYSEKELKEFKEIILDKIQQTNKVLEYLKYSLSNFARLYIYLSERTCVLFFFLER